jgi:hypothetical protein
MPFGIDGQYSLSLSISSKKDFVKKEDFVELTIIEEAGNVLPTFILMFSSTDEDILRLLHEGNVLKCQFGRDNNSLKDISLSVNKIKTSEEGSDKRVYEVSGFAGNINYITDHFLNISDKKSGIEVALETAKKSFSKVSSNITKSFDKQNWIQHNISDKVFINDCYSHAITADGTFILKDILKDIDRPFTNQYDWKLTKEAKLNKEITYDADYIIENQSGLINNWLGYGRKLIIDNAVTGVQTELFEKPKTVLSLSKDVPKDTTIDSRYGGEHILSENMHEKYHSAYNHNAIGLSNLSKVEQVISFSNYYYPVKPLDLIMFSAPSTELDSQSSEQVSGLYIASKVARTIQSDRMVTTLLLNREAFNKVKNEGLI